jgi:hypothetical protein
MTETEIGPEPPFVKARSVAMHVADPLREVVLLIGAALAYFGVRALTKSDQALAVAHADAVVAFERHLYIQVEGNLQQLIVDNHALVTVANWYYIFGHWPVILASFIWLYAFHRDAYRHLRDAMFISGLIGLVIFWRYPVAPPRLADIGLVDTVTQYSHTYRVLQPPAIEDRFASLPSLHVGWNLLVGITLATMARHRIVRVVAALSPLAMAAAVVLTANHYIVDVLLGGSVALLGLVVSFHMPSWPRRPHLPVTGARSRAVTKRDAAHPRGSAGCEPTPTAGTMSGNRQRISDGGCPQRHHRPPPTAMREPR